MSAHDYLVSRLSAAEPSEAQLNTLRSVRDAIESALRRDFGSMPRFYYGGSFAKGTMNRASFDLDLVLYFPSDHRNSVSAIYESVRQSLTANRFYVIQKTVALRLPYEGGFHVDVVPGRAHDATFKYATLFRNERPPSTLQTSLKVHIDAVRKSGLAPVIRLLKLWRDRNALTLPSFAIEILAARSIQSSTGSDLATATWTVLEHIRTEISRARLVDPANTNNVVDLSATVRSAAASVATASLRARTWDMVL